MEESRQDTENAPQPLHAQTASKTTAKGQTGLNTAAKEHAKSASKVKEVVCIKTALQAKSINSARRPGATLPPKKTSASTTQAAVRAGKSGDGSRPLRTSPPVVEDFRKEAPTSKAESTQHATPARGHASPSLSCVSPFLTGTSPGFAESSSKRDDELYQMLNVGKDENSATGDLAQLPDQRIRSLEIELHSRKRTLEALTARASAERAELLARHAADREAYDRIIRDAEVTIANLRSQLESRSVRDSEPEGSGVAANARIKELEALLCDKEAEIRKLTERLHLALNSRVPKLELEIAIQDRDSFAAELEGTRALLDETKVYLEEMEQRETQIVELEDKLQAKETQISALEQERARQDDRRLDLEKHVDELETAVEELIQENEKLHRSNGSIL